MKTICVLFLLTLSTVSCQLFSQEQFFAAIKANGYRHQPTTDQYLSFANNTGTGLITTKTEAAMFLAQIIVESGGLRYKRELACIKTGCPGRYESVGFPNKTYFGRGYIQLTHSYNYKAASMNLFGDDRLLRWPEMVADNETIAWTTSFWYWKTRVHFRKGVNEGNFGATTLGINGGLCKHQRLWKAAVHRFNVYKKVLKEVEPKVEPNEKGCYN